MPNPCEGCPINCCVDFTITSPPPEIDQTLAEFPFIHQTSRRRIPSTGRRDTIIKIFNCTRFNPIEKTCDGYDTIPRPGFCERTGTIAKPHSKCLLEPSS